jgi:hypothetical protein
MNLYTYSQAAELLNLAGRSAVARRILSLTRRGVPLTIEAGELQQVGARKLITDAGMARLREFLPGKSGRPVKEILQTADFKENKPVDNCSQI